VSFNGIDDEFWEIVKPYLPPQKAKTGIPRSDLRKTFNGIIYVLRTGINWIYVPRMYGNKFTIHRLHLELLELCETGAYAKIFGEMISRGHLDDKIDSSCCNIDTKAIPAEKE
jgi:transposase